jgi:hypothetical protein
MEIDSAHKLELRIAKEITEKVSYRRYCLYLASAAGRTNASRNCTMSEFLE